MHFQRQGILSTVCGGWRGVWGRNKQIKPEEDENLPNLLN